MTICHLEVDVAWTAGAFDLRMAFKLDEARSAIFGPSGSGKTSLLNLIAGITRPSNGRIVLGEHVLFDSAKGIRVPPERRGIGYVFQQSLLFPHLSVERNLRFSPRANGGSEDPGAPGFDHLVDMLQLDALLSRAPKDLSGGEAQRVALGRALLSRPQVLMLDEPFTGLDSALKARLMPCLRRVQQELAIPTITVSHSVPDILALADDVLVMDRGCLLAQGGFFDALRDEAVFSLAHAQGLENVLEVEVLEHDEGHGVTHARLGDQVVVLPLSDLPEGRKALVSLRPDDVILSAEPLDRISAQNSLVATVGEVIPITNGFLVRLDMGQPLRVEVTEMARSSLHLEPGLRVFALAKTFSFRWLG